MGISREKKKESLVKLWKPLLYVKRSVSTQHLTRLSHVCRRLSQRAHDMGTFGLWTLSLRIQFYKTKIYEKTTACSLYKLTLLYSGYWLPVNIPLCQNRQSLLFFLFPHHLFMWVILFHCDCQKKEQIDSNFESYSVYQHITPQHDPITWQKQTQVFYCGKYFFVMFFLLLGRWSLEIFDVFNRPSFDSQDYCGELV